MRRFFSIAVIWLGCALAWMLLGATVLHRSGELSGELREEVRLLWGPPIEQQPPRAFWLETVAPQEPGEAPRVRETPASVERSDIEVSMALEQRQKGLLWFPTYAVDFQGRYAFTQRDEVEREVVMHFPLPPSVVFDAFAVIDEAGKPVDVRLAGGDALWSDRFTPGQERSYTVSYRSRGTESWRYALHLPSYKAKNFSLSLAVDTPAVDFPPGTLSPTAHEANDGKWQGSWSFASLVSGADIAVDLPQRLNPGPLVANVTFFAPVSLLFFFFVVAILAAARCHELHPMHYLLVGCAFFSFHLLFAYLVDHVPVSMAFVVSAATSMALTTSYARLFVGWRFALCEMGLSQLVYLVLFSMTFFWQGFTGLAITLGAVATLFVIMQITGRLDWQEAFASLKPRPPAAPPRNVPGPGLR
jgi:inner membrane protein CreD